MNHRFTPRTSERLIAVLAMLITGALLLFLAAILTSARLENLLLGEFSGRLAWGTPLFRGLLAFHGLACWVAAGSYVAKLRAESASNYRRTVPNEVKAGPGARARSWVAIGTVCGVALALRLWRLDTGLWLDEVLTLVDFIRLPLGEIITRFPSQNQHMLYSILGHLSSNLLGESASSIRIPAVLFGVGSICALYLLGLRLSGEREALLASLLMTVSYHHVWFSQNARGYSGLLFFTILSTWLWLEALSKGNLRLWFAYAAALILGLWIHLTMVFVWLAHELVYLVILVRCGKDRKVGGGRVWRRMGGWSSIGAYLFATTASLQLYALSLPEFLRTALHETSLKSEWTHPIWAVRETLVRLGDASLVGLAAVAALLVAAVGWVSILRRDWRAGLVMVLPGLLGGAITIALGHNIWPRFFFFCMGFAVLLAVRGVMIMTNLALRPLTRDETSRLPARTGTVAVVAVIVASTATVPRSYALPKQDFSGAHAYVEQHRRPDDGIVAVGLAATAFNRYFAPDWPTASSLAELESIEALHSTVWVVYTLPIQLRAWHPDIWDKLKRDYEIINSLPGTLGGGELVICRRARRLDGQQREAATPP